jgi:N-acetylglucosaminyldiphosphoundecaprenol N-acetyl-beta-D-mannosaminyltransferase
VRRDEITSVGAASAAVSHRPAPATRRAQPASRGGEYLEARYPRLKIAGAISPPFRPLTEAEDRAICDAINGAEPDIILVGLGTPKQDLWIDTHRDKIAGSVMIAVGAAYDFFSGRIPMAPRPIQEAGFAWLYRLLGPDRKRLWRRYTIDHGYFLWQFGKQLVGLEHPDVHPRPDGEST